MKVKSTGDGALWVCNSASGCTECTFCISVHCTIV